MSFGCALCPYELIGLMRTQTEEMRLQIITTAKISSKFSQESPYISNMFSWESSNFHSNFHVGKGSPRHSKDLSGKLIDLEIQII